MKQLLKAIPIMALLLAVPALAQTPATISGNLKDMGIQNVSAAGTYILFELKNFGSPGLPRTTSGLFVNTQIECRVGGVTCSIDANGVLSGSIARNDSITPAGTEYEVCVFNENQLMFCDRYTILAATFDLNTAVPTTTQVITGPSGQVAQGFRHAQTSANATWTINHNFGTKDVQCDFYDDSDVELTTLTSFTETDANTATAIFSGAESGHADCVIVSTFTLATSLTNVLDLQPTAAQSGGLGQSFTWTGNLLPSTLTTPLLRVNSDATSSIPVRVDAFAGQTANLQEWRDSADSNLSVINATGQFAGPIDSTSTLEGLTAGSVLFCGASCVIAQDNDGIFWDDVLKRLGVGTATPSVPLHVFGGGNTSARFANNADEKGEVLLISGLSAAQGAEYVLGTFGNLRASVFGTTSAGLPFVEDGSGTLILQAAGIGTVIRTPGTVGDSVILADGNGNTMLDCADVGTTGDCKVTRDLQVDRDINVVAGIVGYLRLPTAGCNDTTAATFWDLPTADAPVAACVTGSNVQKAVMDFNDTTDQSMQITDALPNNWTGAVDVEFYWIAAATTNAVSWFVETVCTDASESDDQAFQAAGDTSTVVDGTTNDLNLTTISGITMTGCTAGDLFHLKVGRDADGSLGTDTMTGDARLILVKVKMLTTGAP